VVAVTTVDVTDWKHRFAVLMATLGSLFVRPEPRATACAYLRGLLSAVERKNSWWLAEAAGHASPRAMQRLLTTARWDADAARDLVRSQVVDHLGPGGVLIFDETGFLKKGTHSVGVVRWGADEVPAGQVLFQRPPPEPDVPVSEHPALR
jgi:SRSO17 transposase